MSWIERIASLWLSVNGVCGRYVDTSAGRMHLFDGRQQRSLPTVVTLHAVGLGAAPYMPVLLELKKHARRVLAPEALGHGRSASPRPLTTDTLYAAMAELLDRELDEPAVLFGSCMGGTLAVRYAHQHPEKVRALVLSSPTGAQVSPEQLERKIHTLQVQTLGEACALMRAVYADAPWYSPIFAPAIRRTLESPAMKELLASVRKEDLPPAQDLRALRMPVLLLWGERDRMLADEDLDFFRANLPPHAVIQRPERYGHWSHLDAPVELARRIVGFSASVMERSARPALNAA